MAAANRFLTQHQPAAKPAKPSLQDAIRLTDHEAEVLRVISSDYETRTSLFLVEIAPLRMEALLQSLDSGKVTESLAQRITDLQDPHKKMVSYQVQLLKNALGVERFEILDAFVQTRKSR